MSLEQQLCESHSHCEQLNRQHDDVMQELGQVKDELTSEKELRLNVCLHRFFLVYSFVVVRVVFTTRCYAEHGYATESESGSELLGIFRARAFYGLAAVFLTPN